MKIVHIAFIWIREKQNISPDSPHITDYTLSLFLVRLYGQSF